MVHPHLSFGSDYMEGAHPRIIQQLTETNLCKTVGYGLDEYCNCAKEKIRLACQAPDAEVHFFVGGTQANATVIDALLRSYQGVLAADTGHISGHEAGAIEFGGHKVLTLPHCKGKITAAQIENAIRLYNNDPSREHTVMPGMVYLSQPTELGTLYTLQELESISNACHTANIPLFVDGARLAYALACPQNDVTLPNLAKLCDVFYIGGTKCGALFGEAVVIPNTSLIPHFFSIIKQHGALLAKGRLLGIQFDTLFTDDLYASIGITAIQTAKALRSIFLEKNIPFYIDTPTNQIFCILENTLMSKLSRQVEFGYWSEYDESHTVVRFVTSWATTPEDIARFRAVMAEL